MKTLIFTSILLLTGVTIMNLNTKREIKTSIVINQSTQKIWKQMTDTQSYGKWSPFIKSFKGELKEGNKINVFIQPQNEKGMEFNPHLLKVIKNK